MRLHYNNKALINIALNLVQHDQTKYIEIDIHFMKEKFCEVLICAPHVRIEERLADILT